jgi:hypothetical protein
MYKEYRVIFEDGEEHTIRAELMEDAVEEAAEKYYRDNCADIRDRDFSALAIDLETNERKAFEIGLEREVVWNLFFKEADDEKIKNFDDILGEEGGTA